MGSPNPIASRSDRARVKRGCALVVLCFLLAAPGGCATVWERLTPPTRVESRESAEIFVSSNLSGYRGAKLGVLPFQMPPYAAGVQKELEAIYVQELIRSGVLSQVVTIPHPVESDGEAIFWGAEASCDLVMRAEILYLMDGTGSQPTRLDVSVRVLDVRLERLMLYLHQKALSEPGRELDLIWSTVPGEPARRWRSLARSLSHQLASMFAS